ncbi:hypothetical protein ACSSS7_000295 [Eimeria intestinalis]
MSIEREATKRRQQDKEKKPGDIAKEIGEEIEEGIEKGKERLKDGEKEEEGEEKEKEKEGEKRARTPEEEVAAIARGEIEPTDYGRKMYSVFLTNGVASSPPVV